MIATFEHWTNGRRIETLGTNAGAEPLPFQGWRRFKEAFAPELIDRAIRESRLQVEACIDPFGGSGTTALACQFLGVRPTTIEVNPFLADLIAAKLCSYDTRALTRDFSRALAVAKKSRTGAGRLFELAPPTFLQPGVNDRWIFDFDVASRIARLLAGINSVENLKSRRLFRVLLGGILIEVSNVITSGKGRRYRRNWQERSCAPGHVTDLFESAVERAIVEIGRYSLRRQLDHKVICGDARQTLSGLPLSDLAVLSPPYPNSFDYTDVYNVELWTLGYLSNKEANHNLRMATLSSHVQLLRDFPQAPSNSLRLTRVLNKLRRNRTDLWNRSIPEMVGAYFADMLSVVRGLKRNIRPGGAAWIVVGDSQYLDCRIRTAEILADLASSEGWDVRGMERFRSMRSSAQQGGERALDEKLLVLGWGGKG